ncbi:MAG TPA: hypothetical protein VFN49_03725 [Candidatus Aquilonibacter sp.]|nr:hypothetical protein [Candidatus Aquilonibacter sp.]
MAASLTASLVDAAPGNSITLAGSGLTPGSSANVVLENQGLVTPGNLTIPATFAVDGSSVTFTVPDGVTSNTLVVTANDGTQAQCALSVASQYVQAAQFQAGGEGIDTTALAAGVLDEVLRDASAIVDAYIGTTVRLLQVQEDQRFSESRRIWPFRSPKQKIPLVSLDALSFITSNAIQTSFNVSGAAPDVYVNKQSGYFEVQTYAVGNAILLGEIQTIGFSANVWRATYTAGYTFAQYPRDLRKATALIATELLSRANIQGMALGKVKILDDLTVDGTFAVPTPARDLLRPYVSRSLR